MNTAVSLCERHAFCAAHTGLHDGRFERLHGHTFTVTVRVEGPVDNQGMVVDFGALKDAVAAAIAPLHRRTLLAGAAVGVTLEESEGRIRVADAGTYYDLPVGDVIVLPVANTTTEALAGYLLDQLAPTLAGAAITAAEVTLAEFPGVSATVRQDFP